MRLLWVSIAVLALTSLALTLVVGDGTASGGTLMTIYDSHGVNRNDVPVLVLWLTGVLAAAVLYRRE